MPKNAAAVRKPLSAMMTPDSRDADGEFFNGSLVVVCDDGAVFSYAWGGGYWTPMEPVPGTVAASEKEKNE